MTAINLLLALQVQLQVKLMNIVSASASILSISYLKVSPDAGDYLFQFLICKSSYGRPLIKPPCFITNDSILHMFLTLLFLIRGHLLFRMKFFELRVCRHGSKCCVNLFAYAPSQKKKKNNNKERKRKRRQEKECART